MRFKNLICLLLSIAVLLSFISGCDSDNDWDDDENRHSVWEEETTKSHVTAPDQEQCTAPDITETEPQPTEPTAPTEPTEPETPTHPAGEYTPNEYNSKWLDLSFQTPIPMEATDYMIEDNQYFNSLQENDPYADYMEMTYYWKGTKTSAVSIYVTALQDGHASLNTMAEQAWEETRSFYVDLRSYGYNVHFYKEENQTISFLNHEYIMEFYRVVSDNGRGEVSDMEYWNLYRIQDEHLVSISFSAPSLTWTLDNFMMLFTSYDGSVVHEYKIPDSAPEITDNGIFNILTFETVWKAKYYTGGYFYDIYFVFEQNGTCYYALGDTELWDAGKGTYTVSGYTLSLEITAGGKKLRGTYRFVPDSNTLLLTSYTGILNNTGEIYMLKEDPYYKVEKIKNWGNEYMSSSVPAL